MSRQSYLNLTCCGQLYNEISPIFANNIKTPFENTKRALGNI